MSVSGYIYVLASSAHSELVKVGKTSRSPQDRADELSSSTGVPVPFIVVWAERVGNIDACERLVHKALEDRGVRPSSSREFFHITPTDAVRTIVSLNLADTFPPNMLEQEASSSSGFEHPGLGVFHDALIHAYGGGSIIKNDIVAERLFLRSADLGWLPAFFSISEFYANDTCLKFNRKKGLEFALRGHERGDVRCLFQAARIYADLNDEENFQYYARAYFQSFVTDDGNLDLKLETTASQLSEFCENIFDHIGSSIFDYVAICLGRDWACESFPAILVFEAQAQEAAVKFGACTGDAGQQIVLRVLDMIESLASTNRSWISG